MPNRIIKESAFLSERIAELSDFQFRLWVGLITQADDAGRGDARPAIIKGRVFALRERVTVKEIDVALHALAEVGCVSLYEVDGKPYYAFPRWQNHQRVRDCKPKYPAANDDGERKIAADCGELPRVAAKCGYNPIQSNSNTNLNPNTDKSAKTRFTPPTIAEVKTYCEERGNKVNAEHFVDYYSAQGWKLSNGVPMKDWKAAVRNWEQRDGGKKQETAWDFV